MSDLIGTSFPSVDLLTTDGEKLNLANDLRGSWFILYIYPKDDTPGCTKQACGYRDNLTEFEKIGVKVYGLSLDNVESHKSFSDKYSLNFPLLADVKHELSEKLGSFGDQAFGTQVFKNSLSRDSFLVNPAGQIVQVWRKVNPTATIEETYEAVKAAQS